MSYPEKPNRRAYEFWYGAAALLLCWTIRPVHAQPAPPESPDTAEARQRFEAGVADYEAGNYGEALGEFEQAFRLKPHPVVQVNIANCYDKLKRPVEAVEHFEAFLSSGEGAAAQRDEVQAALTELSRQVGKIVLHVQPSDAHAILDEQLELRPGGKWVAPGRHHLAIAAPGYGSATRVVDVNPGEVAELSVELPPLLPPAPTPTPPIAAVVAPPAAAEPDAATAQEQARNGLSTNVWISGGATFVLGITAAVTGQLALAANREFDTNLSAVRNPMLTEFQRAGAWARGVDAANRAETLAAATDVLLALTAVGVGLTAYLYVTDPAREASAPSVSLQAAPGSGRVQLRGHF
jgi:hypothetical protein